MWCDLTEFLADAKSTAPVDHIALLREEAVVS
jgi:hypothetical protein